MRRWIEEGRVSADTLVWRDGWEDWQAASDVLAEMLSGSSARPSAPVAEEPVLDLLEADLPSDDAVPVLHGKRRKGSSKKQLAVAMVVVLCLLTLGLLVALIVVITR